MYFISVIKLKIAVNILITENLFSNYKSIDNYAISYTDNTGILLISLHLRIFTHCVKIHINILL